jgi:hypothetical protein
MKTHGSIIIVVGLLFLFTLIFGFSLSRKLSQNDPRTSGLPLAGGLPTAHKLAALAVVITFAMAVRKLHAGVAFGGVEWTAVVVTGLLFLILIVTGSVLSLGKAVNAGVQVAHKVFAILGAISTFGAIYLLTRGRR